MKTLIWIKQNILYLLGIGLAFFSIFAFFEFYCKLLADCSDILIKYWVTPVMSKINGWYAVFLIVLGLIYLLITCWVEKVWNKTHLILIALVFWIYAPARRWGPWEFYPLYSFVAYSDIIFLLLFIEIGNIIRIKMRKRKDYDGLDYCSPKEKGDKEDGDKYGRKNYAKSVAKHIAKSFPPDQSFATGIVGDWGSGKSWFLDEIKNVLVAKDSDSDSTGNTKPAFMQKMKKRLTYKENILIIEYKPWFCDSPNDIVRDFFALYKQKLSPYLPSLSGNIEQYAALLTEVVDDDWVKNGWVKKAVKAVQIMGQQEEAAQEYFEKISKTLKKAQFKVLIVIDDLDRLQADEILEVLRLIRNTACFPYTHFLVAYDRTHFEKALYKKNLETRYLEKIFNFEIALPKFEGNVICNMLNEYLEKFEKKGQFEDWGNLKDAVYTKTTDAHNDYLMPQILKTKRDVIRFYNSFKVNLGAYLDYENPIKLESHKAEISAVDFFYLELIRYGYPKVYDMLRNDALKIDGLISDGLRFNYSPTSPQQNTQPSNKKYEPLSSASIEKFDVPTMLLRILFGSINLNGHDLANLNSFIKYFAYRADSRSITLAEVIAALGQCKDLKDEESKLILDRWNDRKQILKNELKNRLDRLLKPMDGGEGYSYTLQEQTIEFIDRLVKENGKATWAQCAQEAQGAAEDYLKNINFYKDEYVTVENLRNAANLWHKTFEWYTFEKSPDHVPDLTNVSIQNSNNFDDSFDRNMINKLLAIKRLLNENGELSKEEMQAEVKKVFQAIHKPSRIISLLGLFLINTNLLSTSDIDEILAGYLTMYMEKNSEIDQVGHSLFFKYDTLFGSPYPKEKPSIVKSLNAFVRRYPSVYINEVLLTEYPDFVKSNDYHESFFTNDEMSKLIKSDECKSFPSIDRIRNFWRLYEANGYKSVNKILELDVFEKIASRRNPRSQTDIEKFVPQIEKLDKIRDIELELNQSPSINRLKELKTEVENNPLNILLKDNLLKEIESRLGNSTSRPTSPEEA